MASLWEQTKQLVNDGITYVDASTNDFVDVLQETNLEIMDEVLVLDSSLDKDERGAIFMDHIITNPEFRQNFLDAKAAQPEAFQDLMGTLNLDAEQVNQQVALLDNSIVKNALNNHPDAMKSVLNAEDGQRAEVFQQQMAGEGFRHSMVGSVLDDPQALKELVQNVPELNQNAQIQEMMPVLDNQFNLHIARSNPEMVQEMLDPENAGTSQEVMGRYMDKPEVRASVLEGAHLYRDDAVAYQNSLETPNPDLAKLLDLSPEILAQAVGMPGDPTKNITQLSLNAELDPIIALAKDDPAAGGRAFVNKIARQMEDNPAAAQANADALGTDTELMTAIGEDIIKNGIDIKSSLPGVIANDPDAVAQFSKEHPEIMQASVPIMAADNPANAANMAMNGVRETLTTAMTDDLTDGKVREHQQRLDSLDGFEKATEGMSPEGLEAIRDAGSIANLRAVEGFDMSKLGAGSDASILKTNLDIGAEIKAEVAGEVNTLMEGLERPGGFRDQLGPRLADVDQAGIILDNISSIDSMGGGSDFSSMKIVVESLGEDPNGGLDILASEQFAGLAMQRWGGDIMNAKIDNVFNDMENALADFGKTDAGMMLKDQFGIDLGQMAGALGGFKGMLQEHLGPMVANLGGGIANLQAGNGIVNSINDRLADSGKTIGMNSTGGDLSGIVNGAQSHLANAQHYAANMDRAHSRGLSGAGLDDYVQRQIDSRVEMELTEPRDDVVVDAKDGKAQPRQPHDGPGVQVYAAGEGPKGDPLKVEDVSNDPSLVYQ